MSRSDRTLPSILDAVGDTPLVELSRFTAGLQGRMLAKLEYVNPCLFHHFLRTGTVSAHSK